MNKISKIWLVVGLVEVAYIAVSTALTVTYGWDSFTGEVFKSLARLATLVVYAVLAGKLVEKTPDNPSRTPSGVLILLAVLLTSIPAFVSVRPQEDLGWMMLFASGSFLVGFREELLYRVLVQTTLVNKWSPVRGILATSGIFTVYHLSYFLMGSWLAIAEVFLFSLAIGILFLVSRSFLLVALVHSFYDFFFILSPFPQQILPEIFLIYLLVALLVAVALVYRKNWKRSSP